MDCRTARALLLALTGAVSLPAAAWAQTPPAAPAPPPESQSPPPEVAAPAEPAPEPPPAAPPPAPPPAPVPATLPSTWGPTEPEEAVAESARPPAARPRLSAAVGMGGSFDSVGFKDGVHALPSFFTVLGIGDGLFGLDLGAFASSARREDRASNAPIDRLAVDLFGVVRPAAHVRPDDRSFNMRVLHALAVELGLGFEREGRSAISGTRFLVHTGARADLPISPAHEPTELWIRLAVRRGFGLYDPKLYGSSASDVTTVSDSAAELYAALVVVF